MLTYTGGNCYVHLQNNPHSGFAFTRTAYSLETWLEMVVLESSIYQGLHSKMNGKYANLSIFLYDSQAFWGLPNGFWGKMQCCTYAKGFGFFKSTF